MRLARGHRRRTVVLLSGIHGHGGIQRYNRTLCKALTQYAAEHDVVLDVVSLHDPAGWHDPHVLREPVTGCAGNRRQFVLRALQALARPCDLVINCHVDFATIALGSRIRASRPPILTLTYGIEVWSPLPWYKRLALAASDWIWTISDYTREQLIAQQGIASSVIAVVPVPLDPDFFRDIDKWRASGKVALPSRMLSVTRMNTVDARKGIDRVIMALPVVRERVDDLSYVVVGDGDTRPDLERLARDTGVGDAVRFVGRVSDEELHAHLSGTDIFVLPSAKEGFGIVFVEAMAYGKPVIGGAHGGTPEVVVDGQTGVLVGYDDREALADALIHLLQDPERRRTMGHAGVQRAGSAFSYDLFRSRVEEALDRVLAPRSRAAPAVRSARGASQTSDSH